jgi:hypothetical protein
VKHQLIKPYGTVFDYPARAIPDDKCSFSDDVMYQEGYIKQRWGYANFDRPSGVATLPLDGAVQGIFHYKKLSTGDDYIVAVTTTDVYKYDSTNGWTRITRSYNTGTVTSSGTGNRTITLTSGAWGETTIAWVIGGDLNTARRYLAGCGTQSAGLSFGGYVSSGSAVTEEYDGTSWTAGNNLNTARYGLAGCGTQSAGLSFGGSSDSSLSVVTEEYDGTNWTTGAGMNMSTAIWVLAGCGTQSAGLSFGGQTSTGNTALSEVYDGTSWASANDLNIARRYLAGCGTQSAGLSFGGHVSSSSAVTEETRINNMLNFGKAGTKIAFGTTDINSSGTWYTISSFDSYSQVTLSSDLSPAVDTSTFVMRFCNTAAMSNITTFAQPYDDFEDDFILIHSNGTDKIARWDGTGSETVLGYFELTCTTATSDTITTGDTSRLAAGMYVYGSGVPEGAYIESITSSTVFVISAATTSTVSDTTLSFSNMPDIAKFVGYFGSVGYEHVAIANTKNSAGVEANRKIAFSYAGEPEQWLSNNTDIYYELLSSNDAVVGIVPLGGRLYAYKEHSITEMWPDPNGGNEDPFNFTENKILNIGTPAIRSVCNIGTAHIFFGWDNFYMFDGMSVKAIGDPLKNYFGTLITDDAKLRESFAFLIEEETLYVFFCVTGANTYCDTAFVYNYTEDTWTKWTPAHAMTAAGKYRLQSDDTPVYLVGDSAGYIYKIAPTYTADARTTATGVSSNYIASTFITKDYPLNDPKHTFRLIEVVFGLIKQSATTSCQVYASVDYGVTWSSAVTVTANSTTSGDYIEYIANFIQRGRQVRFKVMNVDGSQFKIESMNIGFNDVDPGTFK